MKRELTTEEIDYIIEDEDKCGVATLLQELFALKNPIVIADISSWGEIGVYEVIEKDA